jgi:hypothetical protein
MLLAGLLIVATSLLFFQKWLNLYEEGGSGSLLRRGKCGSMRTEESEKKMTKRIEGAKAPAPLEEYVRQFDAL